MAGTTALAPAQHTPVRRPRGPLLRWFVSYGSFAVPQAAAPIAFSLIALPLTGNAASGAAMMLAMTIAQVLGAVPITRLGRRFSPIPFLRVLIGLRTLALVGIAVLAGMRRPLQPRGGRCRARGAGQRRCLRHPPRCAEPPGAREPAAALPGRCRDPERGHLRRRPGARGGARQHLPAGRGLGDGGARDGPDAAAATNPRPPRRRGPEQRATRLRLSPMHHAVAGVRRRRALHRLRRSRSARSRWRSPSGCRRPGVCCSRSLSA